MITNNVLKVIDDVNNAALSSGRDPSDITIVAVTKTRTVDEIEEALEAGIGKQRKESIVKNCPA